MSPVATPDRLTDADFVRLRDFVYRRTGIRFASTKRYFVDKRVVALVEESGAHGFDAYFSLLRVGDPSTVQDLVNALTVNETYFLREEYQFRALVRSVLPQVLADRQALGIADSPIRILSLPSSTGEEPYSIAIRLLEDWPSIQDVDVSLHAADIDTRVLAEARRGVYGARSVSKVPADELARWFRRRGDGSYQVVDELRESVSFERVNVCDPESMARYRGFDVVFCRNLLIYFDATSSRVATDNLHAALRPGGFLLLGHSESMSRISTAFVPRRLPDAVIYQRPAGPRRPGGPTGVARCPS